MDPADGSNPSCGGTVLPGYNAEAAAGLPALLCCSHLLLGVALPPGCQPEGWPCPADPSGGAGGAGAQSSGGGGGGVVVSGGGGGGWASDGGMGSVAIADGVAVLAPRALADLRQH